MPLSYPDKIKIGNPLASGIVDYLEVSGSRNVATLEELYAIADPILSPSKNNTNNDALGQEWYVVAENTTYKLVDWNNRKSAAGWEARSSSPTRYVATNPELTVRNGEVNWEVTHNLGIQDVIVQVVEVATNTVVYTGITLNSVNSLTIYITSNKNIAPGTYRVIVS